MLGTQMHGVRVSCSKAGSAQQLVRDHLVTMGVLAQDRELAVGKDEVQIRGLPGRTCPFKLVTELLLLTSDTERCFSGEVGLNKVNLTRNGLHEHQDPSRLGW